MEKIENNLKGELEFLCYLHRRRYPAVIPVTSNSGELVVTLDSIWENIMQVFLRGLTEILLKIPTVATIVSKTWIWRLCCPLSFSLSWIAQSAHILFPTKFLCT